jgi:hypothetical protein
MTLLGNAGDVIVEGTIQGTVNGDAFAFTQDIAFFQFPQTSPYWQIGIQTTGILTIGDRIHPTLTGRYTGMVAQLRSRLGPPSPGTPFTNGTLTLVRP